MGLRTKTTLLLAFVAALFTAAPSSADGLGRLTNASGGRPATVMIENPQDSLRLWHTQGQKGRTLLLVSEEIPLARLDDTSTDMILKQVSEGRFDGISAPDYQTYIEYPVNRADYVFLAARAGMISKVYWVPPTKESLGTESLERVKGNMQSLGATDAELAALVQTGSSISGTVNGVPLYICNLRDLPAIDEQVVLAVDLSFFTTLYRDEVNTPYLGLVTTFMHALASSGVKASDAVISFSTSVGPVPLEHRFIGGYLEKFLNDPGSLADGPPEAWLLRAEGMYYETFFQSEEELKVYKRAVKASPGDASLRYSLAMAYFSVKDIDGMKDELDRAVALDKGYYHAYITYGAYLAGKDLPAAGEDFVAEAARISPNDPAVLEAAGSVKRAAGKYAEAIAAQKKLIAMGYEGPMPYYRLAGDYLSIKDYANAIECYNKALGMLPVLDTEIRPQALLGLAQTYESSGKVTEALETYRSAMDATLDGHARDRIRAKHDELKMKWAPFMGGERGGR